MGMMSEFKEFVMKGNAMDLAIGVIIGAAFGKIVDSIVKDLIMPIVGMFGNVDFSNLFIVLGKNPNNLTSLADLQKANIPTLAYGNFITTVINFLILAFIIFMLVKQMNRLKQAPPAGPPPAPPEDISLLREIRDALKR
jgi:large conductance mechanosensitive channel